MNVIKLIFGSCGISRQHWKLFHIYLIPHIPTNIALYAMLHNESIWCQWGFGLVVKKLSPFVSQTLPTFYISWHQTDTQVDGKAVSVGGKIRKIKVNSPVLSTLFLFFFFLLTFFSSSNTIWYYSIWLLLYILLLQCDILWGQTAYIEMPKTVSIKLGVINFFLLSPFT